MLVAVIDSKDWKPPNSDWAQSLAPRTESEHRDLGTLVILRLSNAFIGKVHIYIYIYEESYIYGLRGKSLI